MGELVDHVDEHDRVVGVVDRREAVAASLLYRMSMVLCRDETGRYLVHRRPESSSRFPGEYSWLVAGAVHAGESYAEAAGRELLEEMGVRASVRPLFTFLCRGELSPYWFAVYEATVSQEQIAPQVAEVAWHGWLSGTELRDAMTNWKFVSDSRDAYRRYLELSQREGRLFAHHDGP
ncbi:NUDIX hydrolase [Streptomyces sp. 021-4]|uniref:NUDIX hydrolase n=1 Tax=Streptomyces sp. 021-4 TaxID=2789260 RepID=UPI0039F600B3